MDVMNSAAFYYPDGDHNGPSGNWQQDPNSWVPYHEDSEEQKEGVTDLFNNVSDFFTNGVQSWWQGSRLNPKNWFNHMLFGNNIFESTNSASSQGKIAYTSTGIPYDETNIDSQINALMQEYAYKRDDESYDRLVAALKRNGINPAIALSGSASPMSSDNGYRSNYSLTDKDQINSALRAGSILALLLGLLMKTK